MASGSAGNWSFDLRHSVGSAPKRAKVTSRNSKRTTQHGRGPVPEVPREQFANREHFEIEVRLGSFATDSAK